MFINIVGISDTPFDLLPYESGILLIQFFHFIFQFYDYNIYMKKKTLLNIKNNVRKILLKRYEHWETLRREILLILLSIICLFIDAQHLLVAPKQNKKKIKRVNNK